MQLTVYYSPEAAWLASSLAAATPLPGAPSTAEEEADPAPDVAAPVVAAAPVDAAAAAEAPVAELSRCPADAAVVSDEERFVPPLCPRLLIPELLRLLLTKLRQNQVYSKYKFNRSQGLNFENETKSSSKVLAKEWSLAPLVDVQYSLLYLDSFF